MKPSLQPGLTSVKRIPIDADRTISFMGEGARVYATPRLISDIEFTCRDLLLQHADPGEDSVGMEVAVKHLAPTLAGSTVEISVRITAVDGRKVSFDVSAKDELDTVRTALPQGPDAGPHPPPPTRSDRPDPRHLATQGARGRR